MTPSNEIRGRLQEDQTEENRAFLYDSRPQLRTLRRCIV